MDNKYLSLILFFLMVSTVSNGQKGRPFVTKVDLNINGDRVIVDYDLCNTVQGRSYHIDLLMIDERFNLIHPDTVCRDIGPEVYGGEGKQMIWDVRKDPKVLRGNYKPAIMINGIWESGAKGGPANAFLSVLFPGLGDYYVSNVRKRKIKPWYISLASAGLIGLSFTAGNNRQKETVYSSQINKRWEWDPNTSHWFVVTEVHDFTYEGETLYWLFPYDQEIFLGAGAAIWLADIIYVWAKGGQNEKIRKSKLLNMPGVQANMYAHPSGAGVRLTLRL